MKKLGEAIGKFVVKHRILIVIASILLCIPSLFGYINTDINYDILVYLPEDIDTMKGQDILAEDFDMGSFAMCVVENMSSKDILDLEEKYKDIEGKILYKFPSIKELDKKVIVPDILIASEIMGIIVIVVDAMQVLREAEMDIFKEKIEIIDNYIYTSLMKNRNLKQNARSLKISVV